MPGRRPRASSAANRALTLILSLVALVILGGATAPAETPTPPAPTPSSTPAPSPSQRFDLTSVPLLAYYYIWYDTSSWDRAKSDMPLLGAYSSDDESVMRQHVTWAKSSGLDGFIVSWKNTTTLDKRLDTLVRVADEMSFKLEIIYEGLDFNRNPLPATQVAEDLAYFRSHYAADPAFDLFGKPLVVWSGTWEFSPSDVALVTGPLRGDLQILASERSIDGFLRLANLVDGNAYYWSSVDPNTSPTYEDKLTQMGAAVHDAAGLWIAPAAPGFDARLVGGTTVVDREGGKMLERQLGVALDSFPDAIGVISWNEFSENSEIEPSKKYGDQALQVLADMTKANYTSLGDFDSSSPGGVDVSAGIGRILAILLVVGTGIVGAVVTIRRRRRPTRR